MLDRWADELNYVGVNVDEIDLITISEDLHDAYRLMCSAHPSHLSVLIDMSEASSLDQWRSWWKLGAQVASSRCWSSYGQDYSSDSERQYLPIDNFKPLTTNRI